MTSRYISTDSFMLNLSKICTFLYVNHLLPRSVTCIYRQTNLNDIFSRRLRRNTSPTTRCFPNQTARKMSTTITQRPKEIALQLMNFIDIEKRNGKSYLKYSCPIDGCSSSVISFHEQEGYTNPYTHLKSCCGLETSTTEQGNTIFRLFQYAASDEKC